MERDAHKQTSSEGYMAAYGLTYEPFGDVISPALFYPGATREQRLNLLLHLIPLGEALLITGVAGIGKSTLLNQFLAKANESWRVCHIDASEGLDANLLLKQLLHTFAPELLEQTDRREQERLLIAQLVSLRKQAQIPILLIDNAHSISESALRTLSKFVVGDSEESKCFGVALFSEAKIEEKLNNPALQSLRAQIKHTFELPLLREEETLQYLDHRMRAAGLQGDSPFTSAVHSAIFSASKGLPLKINELAQAVLQNKSYTAPQSTTMSTAPDVDAATVPVKRSSVLRFWPVLVAVVLAAVLLFQDKINALFTSPPPQPKEAMVEDIEQPSPEADAATLLELPVVPIQDVSREALPDLELIEPPPSDTTQTAESIEEHSVTFDDGVADQTGPDAVSDVIDEPIPQDTHQPTISMPVSESGVEDGAIATSELLAEEQKAEAKPQSDTEQSEWVIAQSPQAYTLQIVAQKERQKREAFISRFGLDGQVQRFSTDKKSQRWYVAASGVYDTRTEALEASRQLPEGVVPWVRSFASIQKELWREASSTEGDQHAVMEPVELPAMPIAITEDEQWVLARPPAHFVLQLVAFEKEANTRNFIASHALEGTAKLVRLVNKGRVWYVAVYGDAADRAAADVMAKNLKNNNNISSPWVRSYDSLQHAMKLFQQQ